MDLPRLNALWRQWTIVPPVAELVAVYLKYKPPDGIAPTRELTDDDKRRQAAELMAMFGGGVVR